VGPYSPPAGPEEFQDLVLFNGDWTYCNFQPVRRQVYSDADKNAGSVLIFVPIALVAAVVGKRVMMVICVEPTVAVMVISDGAACTDGQEENSQG
jgi:hypothetical protein